MRNVICFFGPGQMMALAKKIRAQFRSVRKIYLRIFERINPLPVCLGLPLRIAFVHDESPF